MSHEELEQKRWMHGFIRCFKPAHSMLAMIAGKCAGIRMIDFL